MPPRPVFEQVWTLALAALADPRRDHAARSLTITERGRQQTLSFGEPSQLDERVAQ